MYIRNIEKQKQNKKEENKQRETTQLEQSHVYVCLAHFLGLRDLGSSSSVSA